MAVTYDFKTPSVVVIGSWNATAMSDAFWVAKNFLSHKGDGFFRLAKMASSDIKESQFLSENDIWLFDGFGIGCSDTRAEIFARTADNFESVHACMKNLSDVFAHMPVHGMGVNFKVSIPEGVCAIKSLIKTGEVFDLNAHIEIQVRTEVFQVAKDDLIDDDEYGIFRTNLSLSREISDELIEIGFNYHTPLKSMQELCVLSGKSPVDHWFRHSKEVLDRVYSIKDVKSVYF